jgi:hypothetical protein
LQIQRVVLDVSVGLIILNLDRIGWRKNDKMSLERAYKNCITCNNLFECYGDRKASFQININRVMNKAMKALEEERRYITQHEPDTNVTQCVLVDKALEACVKCDKRNASIADLLEAEMPELFGEKE